MPASCSALSTCSGGGHKTLTIDGVTVAMHDGELTALSLEEKQQLFRLALRYKGDALATYNGRVVLGDEATKVKIYDLLGPGVAVVATNIGTAFANVLPGLNGQRVPVDFTGCTQFRIFANVQVITQGAANGLQIVRHSDNSVLFSGAITGAGENELDNGWTALPAAFVTSDATVGFMPVRLQGKAPNATDDPVFRRCQLLVK